MFSHPNQKQKNNLIFSINYKNISRKFDVHFNGYIYKDRFDFNILHFRFFYVYGKQCISHLLLLYINNADKIQG